MTRSPESFGFIEPFCRQLGDDTIVNKQWERMKEKGTKSNWETTTVAVAVITPSMKILQRSSSRMRRD